MRLARIINDRGDAELAFYYDSYVVPVRALHEVHRQVAYGGTPLFPRPDANSLRYLPPHFDGYKQALILEQLATTFEDMDDVEDEDFLMLDCEDIAFDTPVPLPNKVICLAGNYSEHIAEGGGQAVPKEDTFPFFFMKPPTTTIRSSGSGIAIPPNSPDHIDWEVELVVVIGDYLKQASIEEARAAIAGYTIGLDVSNRKLRLNPNRSDRPRNSYHEWLSGKWHDGFAPIGPCVVAADGDFDPMSQHISLTVNGETMQDSNTSNMVFDVYEIVAYASQVMTLEPGDVIMTGTPSGVGDARGRYLKPGDVIEATIEGIGTLGVHMV